MKTTTESTLIPSSSLQDAGKRQLNIYATYGRKDFDHCNYTNEVIQL